MPDQFTETSTRGFGSRLGGSLGGVLIGILLFLASFAVLYWNEGRVDISRVAKTATAVNPDTIATDQNGNLVSVTGPITAAALLGDNLFLKPGHYVGIERNVTTYVWVEQKSSQSKDNLGGSETTNTTYTYVKQWVKDVPDSTQFRHPEGHENPHQSLMSQTFTAPAIGLGAYMIDPSIKLPHPQKVALDTSNTLRAGHAITLVNGDTVFIPAVSGSSLDTPHVGDTQINYFVLPAQSTVTVFGKLNGSTIGSYTDKTGAQIFVAYPGSRDDAIASLHATYNASVWLLRGVGFLMMWFGLMSLFGPLLTLLAIVPIFKRLGGMVVGFVTFIVALVLSIVTILVSIVLHSLVALIVAVVVTAIILIIVGKRWRKPASA